MNLRNLGIGLAMSAIYIVGILPTQHGKTPTLNLTWRPVLYKGMVIIPYTESKAIHVHHWAICASVLILSWTQLNGVAKGFLGGLILQGISYRDAFEFLTDNPY